MTGNNSERSALMLVSHDCFRFPTYLGIIQTSFESTIISVLVAIEAVIYSHWYNWRNRRDTSNFIVTISLLVARIESRLPFCLGIRIGANQSHKENQMQAPKFHY